MEEQSTVNLQNETVAPYKRCLNCGADLHGVYCHKCGQQASNPTPKVWEFILEYMNNAFIWDQKCFQTIWHLIRRPGFLTNEFNAGKFVSYEHPLKLNMFFLFVFVTLFLLFSDMQKADESFDNITKNELVRPYLSLNSLCDNEDYFAKMKESEKDTLLLALPLAYAQEFSEIITPVRSLTANNGERLDTLVATVPRVLLEDGVVIRGDSDVYFFSEKNDIVDKHLELDMISNMWRKLLDILTQYFPLIFLLTSPLLALAVRLLHLKRKSPFISFFIFALHYTAFIELLLLFIYILYLTIQPDFDILQWIVSLASWLYLSIAVRRVYDENSWIMSVVKALLISFVYLMICFVALFVVFVISVIVVVV